MQVIKCEENENILLMSDLHIGRPDVDYRMICRELIEAEHAGADVLINGDIMDCIVPKDKKRYLPSDMHRRLHGKNDIIGAQLAWATEILSCVKPERIKMLGVGNHEDAIEKYHGFNPVRQLCDMLKVWNSYGGYSGVIKYPKFSIHYHHGAGGGSSIASAIGKFMKKMEYTDPDILWLGHKHHRLFAHPRRVLERRGKTVYKDVRCIMTGAYMDTYSNEQASYGEKSDYPPQGKGGVWLRGGSVIY